MWRSREKRTRGRLAYNNYRASRSPGITVRKNRWRGASSRQQQLLYSRCARVRRLPPPDARERHRPAAAGKRSKRRSVVRSVAAAICGSSVVSCFVRCPSSICAADVECPRNDDRMFCNQNTISMEFDSVWSALVLLVCSTNRYRPRHLLVIDIAYYYTKI